MADDIAGLIKSSRHQTSPDVMGLLGRAEVRMRTGDPAF